MFDPEDMNPGDNPDVIRELIEQLDEPERSEILKKLDAVEFDSADAMKIIMSAEKGKTK